MLSLQNRNTVNSFRGGVLKRYFTTLNGTDEYYTFPDVTLTNDFEIEIDFSTTKTSFQYLLGNTSGYSNYLAYRGTSTRFELIINTSSLLTFTTPDLSVGKFDNAKLVRVAGVLSIVANGISYPEDSATTNSDTFTFSRVGQNNNEAYFKGVLANTKITDENGDLIRYYKINEDFRATPTVIDYGSDGSNGTAVNSPSSELFNLVGSDWMGIELIDEPNFDAQGTWVTPTSWSISGGTLNIDNTQTSFLNASQPNVFAINLTYKITINHSLSIGRVDAKTTGESIAVLNVANSGENIIIKKITDTSFYLTAFPLASGGALGSFSSVSAKRILQAP